MLRINRTFASSLALLVVAGVTAPPAAHALLPDAAYHDVSYSAPKKVATVTFQLYNKDEAVQQVKVAGQVYKLEPHSGMKITAPAGSQVVAVTDGGRHRNGDVLFEVSTVLKGTTVSID